MPDALQTRLFQVDTGMIRSFSGHFKPPTAVKPVRQGMSSNIWRSSSSSSRSSHVPVVAAARPQLSFNRSYLTQHVISFLKKRFEEDEEKYGDSVRSFPNHFVTDLGLSGFKLPTERDVGMTIERIFRGLGFGVGSAMKAFGEGVSSVDGSASPQGVVTNAYSGAETQVSEYLNIPTQMQQTTDLDAFLAATKAQYESQLASYKQTASPELQLSTQDLIDTLNKIYSQNQQPSTQGVVDDFSVEDITSLIAEFQAAMPPVLASGGGLMIGYGSGYVPISVYDDFTEDDLYAYQYLEENWY
jgi:hypothetical protein